MIPSTAQARVVVDECVRGGVTDVVACPGSRNAPLLLALDAADRAGRLRLHVRVDERSAGFLAVGLAARSGRVVPVVVTSGTAVANLHPAVLEASHGGVGLLVLSADRPLELVGTGANQTIDAVGLFGGAARASLVLPLAERRPGAVARWRSVVVRALDAAGGADPGPVQLDVPLREPLVDDGPDEGWCEPLDGRPDGGPWTRTATVGAGRPELAPVAGARTLVVAGHGGRADALPDGIPVLAEPSSPLWSDPRSGRVLRAGPWVLGAGLDALRPDQVVVLGRPTLHRSVSRLLADPRVTVLVDPGSTRGWADVAGTARAVGALPTPDAWAPDRAFADAWRAADDAAAACVRDLASGGPALAAAVVGALPAGALLVLGSSNPVRDVALAASPRADVHVVAARGVSGIDGTVSLATGAALAHDGPAYALIGDLTFLHDTNGLLVGPAEPRPDLTLVVANDDGGGIFAQLEQGAPAHHAAFERVFGTPHGADLGALCRAHGVEHRRTSDPGALGSEPGSGVRVIEVPIDRSRRRAEARTIADAVGEVVATTLAGLVGSRVETATT